MIKKLKTNRTTWDKVAPQFLTASALPIWGPFDAGKNDRSLIGPVKGKTFLEIGFGSGRSINYLVKRGARKVYGVDISKSQMDFAGKLNFEAVKTGKVQLFEAPMEKKLRIPPVDAVFSIYAIGWTVDPKKLLSNVYSYLKPGGRFVWSWDHSIFSDVSYQNGSFVVGHSYHSEKEIFLKDWKKSGAVHITYRKTATWFRLLTEAGFKITRYLEPAPVSPLVMDRYSKDPSKYYSLPKAQLIPCTMIWVCEK